MEVTEFFPAGETSFNIPVGITDDEITLEEVEIVVASLRLNNPPSTVELGSLDMTSIEIVDNDGEYCVFVERFGMVPYYAHHTSVKSFTSLTIH